MAALSALVSGLDAELVRLGYKESTMVWNRGAWRYFTRIGEVLALDDGDFDAARGVLTVREGKWGKSRLLPLHPTSTEALQRYRDRLLPDRPGDVLLVTTTGTRPDYSRTRLSTYMGHSDPRHTFWVPVRRS